MRAIAGALVAGFLGRSLGWYVAGAGRLCLGDAGSRAAAVHLSSIVAFDESG